MGVLPKLGLFTKRKTPTPTRNERNRIAGLYNAIVWTGNRIGF